MKSWAYDSRPGRRRAADALPSHEAESMAEKGRRLIREEEARARREGRAPRYSSLGVCSQCCWATERDEEGEILCGCDWGGQYAGFQG